MTNKIKACIMSLGEAMRAVEIIISRGYDAEVRKVKGGYIVYEIKKNRIARSDVVEQ